MSKPIQEKIVMTLQEANLSQLLYYMERHDTGTISAFRSKFTRRQNQQRNRRLLAQLFVKGYIVISVDGIYVENFGTDRAVEVAEDTFFVVDSKDEGHLERDLRGLGKLYDQDSILFIPKPGNEAYLWGTNHTGYPGYGNVKKYSTRHMGKVNTFMTKKRGRPFFFESINREIPKPGSNLGWAAIHAISTMDWREIPL